MGAKIRSSRRGLAQERGMREEQARFAVMEVVKRTPALTSLLFQLRETQTPWSECLKTLQEARENFESAAGTTTGRESRQASG